MQSIHYSYSYKSTQGLKITVSALNGDPDVYIKVNKQADIHQYDYKGAGTGGEVLEISHTDLKTKCD